MENISKRFGATQALRGVSLEVRAGQVMALIGENGAGKSTLMKILSGAHYPDEGSIQLDGRPFRPSGPHAARLAGVSMIYQELNLAPDLNVLDNIMLGQERHVGGWLLGGEQRRRVREVLDLLGHAELQPETPVGPLSPGAKQLVEIARALVMDAQVIVFDEPTSSLTAEDTRRLFEVIRKLRRQGRGIVYISHYLEEIREICDSFTVLRDGQVVGGGALAGVTESHIVAMMVGRTVDELFPQVPHTLGQSVLSLTELCWNGRLQNLSLELRRGEILGIAGLVGAGRTELLRAIFGLDPVRRGQVKVSGLSLRPKPRRMIGRGLGFVSEDRKGEGLAQIRSIADNITYSRLSPYIWGGWLNLWRRDVAVRRSMREMQIKAVSPDQEVQHLSGGNQQKVALARILHQEADILLLDEPTRGIDVGTKSEIYRLIGEAAATGKAVIFVSSYLPELMAICDRIAVMARGTVRDVRPVDQWTEETVMAVAIAPL